MAPNVSCAHCRDDKIEIDKVQDLLNGKSIDEDALLSYMETSVLSPYDVASLWHSPSLTDKIIRKIECNTECEGCYSDYLQSADDFFWYQYENAFKLKDLSARTIDAMIESLVSELDDLQEQAELENLPDGINPVINELILMNPETFQSVVSDSRLSSKNKESLRNSIDSILKLDQGQDWREENGLDDPDLFGPLEEALRHLA